MRSGNRSIHPVDVHVGSMIRMRRKMLGISQDQLAAALGLTFQQVQKYERGDNRVSASKLYETARWLLVHPSFFFEGLTMISGQPALAREAEDPTFSGFHSSQDGQMLARIFWKIPHGQVRETLLQLMTSLADGSRARLSARSAAS